MSDTKTTETPGTPPPPAAPAKLVYKYGGKDVEYDLSKPEDVERLRTRAQIGQFNETKTAELKEKERLFETEKQKLKDDAEIGRGLRGFIAQNPAAGSVIEELYQGFREGVLDPGQVRATLSAAKTGDAASVEAQARASGDPEARALLRQIASGLKAVEQKVEGVESRQQARDKEASISSAVASIPELSGLQAGQSFVLAETRRLVEQGMTAELAASQSLQSWKDLRSEAATAERDRLRGQKDLATASPVAGRPPITETIAKHVDPKAPPRVQAQQRRKAHVEGFREHMRRALGG